MPEVYPIYIGDPDLWISRLTTPGAVTKGQQVADERAAGVLGTNIADGPGVLGAGIKGPGVKGISIENVGVVGVSDKLDGVVGIANSENGHNGVWGLSKAKHHSGVWGDNTAGGNGVTGTSDAPGGVGVHGRGAGWAGQFHGNVEITGKLFVADDIKLAPGDCAEEFACVDPVAAVPGSVVVLSPDGSVSVSEAAYDSRVVGVIAGAGLYRPAIILDHKDEDNRVPVAMLGKVFCRVDANHGAVQVGDLLTTSPTPGHAMKATDPNRAFGSTIGKALASLAVGCDLVPVLIALH